MTTDVAHATARTAGALYLVVVLTGLFSLIYVPSRVTVPGDGAATFDHLVTFAPLLRLGIASFIVNQIAFLVLPLVLYRLLARVNASVAVAMVVFAAVSVPVAMASIGFKLEILHLLGRPASLDAFTTVQLRSMVMLCLDAYRIGILVTTVFWGLWLLPFGYLVFKSGFLPRVLGVLLMMGCFGELIGVFGTVLVPGYADMGISNLVSLPSGLGEIGICLWLLVMGARRTTRVSRGRTMGEQA